MFSKKKKEIVKKDKLKSTIDQDLIIHNMPRGLARKKASSFGFKADSNSGSQELIKGESGNFKKVGAVIIAFGVILIAVLIFLAYRYIVNPKPKTTQPNFNNPVVEDDRKEDLKEDDIKEPDLDLEVNTSTEISVDDDVIIVDDSEATATSSEDIIIPEDEEEVIIPFVLIDTDGDGLYDQEELILGTDINNADTDGDGHSDIVELENGYNPAGPGELKDNPALAIYNSPVANYSILYPLAWNISTTNNDYTVIISTDDSSIVQVTVQANVRMQNILAWYAENVLPGVLDSSRVQKTASWEGLMSEDGRYFYLTDANKSHIYAISYEPAITGQVAYPNIFKMIINSLLISGG